MTMHFNQQDTYAIHLDRWIAETKDAIAAYIAEHGPSVFTAADRERITSKGTEAAQLEIKDSINYSRAGEEITGLERLLFTVRSMDLIDHKACIHDAGLRSLPINNASGLPNF